MKAEICAELQMEAEQLAEVYTNKAPKNTSGIVYEVERVRPLSDTTGAVVMMKSNGQRAVFWFHYITKRGKREWRWLTVTYDHLYGMNRLIQLMYEVEGMNFKANTERPVQ